MSEHGDGIYIDGEVLRRVLRNITIWTQGSPENDEEWIAKVRATMAIQEDFEAILAAHGSTGPESAGVQRSSSPHAASPDPTAPRQGDSAGG